MKVHRPSSFVAPTCAIVMLLALALSFAVSAQALSDDDSLAELGQRIVELYQQGKYNEAIPLAEELVGLTKRTKGDQDPVTATIINFLAKLYLAMGDYAKAEPLFKEALEIRQKVLVPEHPDTATSLNNLAELYRETGAYAKAQPLFEKALAICRKVLPQGHRLTAAILNNLAELYQETGKYAEAQPLFEEALAICRKVLPPDDPDTVTSLNNLAGLYLVMSAYGKAEPLLEEALAMRRKILVPDHPAVAESLNNLAGLYYEMGEYAKAKPLFEEALTIRCKVLPPDHPDTAQSLCNLAYLELDLGNLPEAKRLAQLKFSAELGSFAQILSFASENQRLAYQRRLRPYTLLVELDYPERLMATAVVQHKGIVLDSIIEDRLLAETSKDAASRELVERLNANKMVLGQLLLESPVASAEQIGQRIQALEQEVEDLESAMARHGASFGRARRALAVTPDQVQAALPAATVLVEYIRYDHYVVGQLGKSKFEPRYGAVVFSAELAPRLVSLASARDIEASLKLYRSRVRSAGDDEMAAILQRLYHQVWEPVERAFPAKVNAIIVSPDGQLNFVSFATLLDGDNRFVAEKYFIRYVASGRDLLREAQPTLSKQVVVLANPKFDKNLGTSTRIPENYLPAEGSRVPSGAEKRDIENLSFEELEGTQTESTQLLLKFGDWGWQATSLTGPDVTKRALLDLHNPYILHLATHGFFASEDSSSEANPSESQSPGIKSDLTKSRFFKNPMHRSGLALAGANTTIAAWKRGEAPPIEDDGILTAEDVSSLDLKGTWLVTLSACDTGAGEAIAGEGVMGLRRGFVEAGAQNLLLTLWSVSDQKTAPIMSDFYDAAHESGNAPQALAEVQREWLVQLRDGKGPKFDRVKDEYGINGRGGLAKAVTFAGPFIMSSQGKP